MSGFLDDMARSSRERVSAAREREPLGALEKRARATPPGPRLTLSVHGFDVIAELKLRSPAQGRLADAEADWLQRVQDYAQGGAAAVSVLTEPSRFDGSLEHLTQAAAALKPLNVPAMRKDFLVDPYQVLEARAAGAGGVLVIVRMLSPAQMRELLHAAAEQQLFVLLEAFDGADLAAAQEALAGLDAGRDARAGTGRAEPVLIGVNCRDLQTLAVVPERFAELAPLLPRGRPCVAESGVATPTDAGLMRALGYSLALIGTALMSRGDPRELLREILATARTVKA